MRLEVADVIHHTNKHTHTNDNSQNLISSDAFWRAERKVDVRVDEHREGRAADLLARKRLARSHAMRRGHQVTAADDLQALATLHRLREPSPAMKMAKLRLCTAHDNLCQDCVSLLQCACISALYQVVRRDLHSDRLVSSVDDPQAT